jgi:hypothetical protein
MVQNQNIQIINVTNNSGLVITWLDGTASNASLVYNSYTKKLYETASETEVDPYKYNVDIVRDQPLYFTGLLNPFRVRNLVTYETVRFINSTGNNLTVKIDILPAYD